MFYEFKEFKQKDIPQGRDNEGGDVAHLAIHRNFRFAA